MVLTLAALMVVTALVAAAAAIEYAGSTSGQATATATATATAATATATAQPDKCASIAARYGWADMAIGDQRAQAERLWDVSADGSRALNDAIHFLDNCR